jgi:hypothetical protein
MPTQATQSIRENNFPTLKKQKSVYYPPLNHGERTIIPAPPPSLKSYG